MNSVTSVANRFFQVDPMQAMYKSILVPVNESHAMTMASIFHCINNALCKSPASKLADTNWSNRVVGLTKVKAAPCFGADTEMHAQGSLRKMKG